MGLNIFNDAVPLLFEAKNIFLTTTVRELLFSGVYINCSYPEDSFPAGTICQGLKLRAPRTYRREGTDFYFSMFNHVRNFRYLIVFMNHSSIQLQTCKEKIVQAICASNFCFWCEAGNGSSHGLFRGSSGYICRTIVLVPECSRPPSNVEGSVLVHWFVLPRKKK